MSEKIQIRRGTDAERLLVTLDQGEPSWSVDMKRFYIGDGRTVGGIDIGGSGLTPPTSATSPGRIGQFATSGSFLYFCTGNAMWGKIAISKF